jgi:hypothetical protein
VLFLLPEGRLEEALLIHSALANEAVETDPALDRLRDRCLNLVSLNRSDPTGHARPFTVDANRSLR